MSHAIKFLSLQKTELAYEVEVRGETAADTVQELRKQIVKLVQLFPSEDILLSPYEPSVDTSAVNDSLSKVGNYIKLLHDRPDKNLLDRTVNLMNHIYHRLNRVDCSNQPEALDACNECFKKFQALKSVLSNIQPTPSVTPVETLESPRHITVTCDRGLTSDLSKLKYNGKTCVRAFILSAADFIKSRSISSSKMLLFATEIFTEDALHWFRSIQNVISTWEEVCDRLKTDFGHSDYDYRFLGEIRARTQGERENITIYLSIMTGMFSQLDRKLNEEEKLEILLHNIRPCYANVLTSCPDIKDIDTLRINCKNFENVQARLLQFREPPKVSSDTLAPEFAYSQPQSSNKINKQITDQNFSQKQSYNNNYYRNSYEQSTKPNQNYYKPNYTNTKPFTYRSNQGNQQSGVSNSPQPVHAVSTGTTQKYCPRCRVDTHGLRNCTAERTIVCFRCGRPGFRYYDCPDCQKTFTAKEPKNE